jgi:RNA polymerase sigma factor (TIGR02999 family)
MSEPAITKLLVRAAQGDQSASSDLMAAVVERLEQIAGHEMAACNGGHINGLTMEPRMLAHDALLKIMERPLAFENRRHFFSYASRVMARAMIDYQRRRNAAKRGGDQIQVTLSRIASDGDIEFFEMPAALEELEALDPRKAELVGLRVFWGASMPEIAEILDISQSTAERDWQFARRWLAVRLAQTDGQDGD